MACPEKCQNCQLGYLYACTGGNRAADHDALSARLEEARRLLEELRRRIWAGDMAPRIDAWLTEKGGG